jgi:hypothetical protein
VRGCDRLVILNKMGRLFSFARLLVLKLGTLSFSMVGLN